MWSTFKITVRSLLLTPSAIIWTLVFPVILATVFNFMFEPLRAKESVEAVDVAVVDNESWNLSPFSSAIESIASEEEPLITVRSAPSKERARQLVDDAEVDGAFLVDAEGEPLLILAPAGSHTGSDSSYDVNRAILEAIITSYVQNRSLITRTAQSNPAALLDAGAVERALSQTVGVDEVSLTHAQPDATIRFYYALLGMASIFAAQLALSCIWTLQPTASAAGARRAVSGTSRMRLMIPTIAGCWTVATLFLGIAFGYICLTANIDFAGRIPICLAGIAVASLLSCSIGALVGSLPGRMGMDSRTGLLTAFTCLLSLFAGLYGQPTMELADSIATSFPASTWINPVCLIRDLFYSAYYYDTLDPFALRAAAGAAFALLFLAISNGLMRRSLHEHL